jgi:hypothetical protein
MNVYLAGWALVAALYLVTLVLAMMRALLRWRDHAVQQALRVANSPGS